MLPEKITLPASLIDSTYVIAVDGPVPISIDSGVLKVYAGSPDRPLPSAEGTLELLKAGIPPVEPMTIGLSTFWLADGRQIFVCTELAENKGKSVTNAWPELAEKILHLAGDVPPQRAVFVEHYFGGSYDVGQCGLDYPETFDLVEIEWDGSRAVGNGWKSLKLGFR
ncbi:hypothetical protein [Sulfuricystis multivorans]|uniref:hypothetical protein n=1 Tax=Sulfuricystis multivorans TaxID=2211108 RepID=UPI000F83A582|nr:hypothetical protein [Sulfuricystis multivorans]